MARSDRAGARGSGAPNMVPVFVAVTVVLVAAVTVTVMNKQAEAPPGAAADGTPADAPAPDIFSDIDNSPRRIGGGTVTRDAPPGLDGAAEFVEAKGLAEQAKTLMREANDAQLAGDEATWREKSIAAREALERAMEVTADWEIELTSRYGDTDVQVREIRREIDGWGKLLTKVRKVH